MTISQSMSARKAEAIARGVSTREIYAVRAENAELWDAEGRRYLDFAAGIAVNNTGHRHPTVMAAVAEQAQAFTHTCFHVAPYEGYIRLAERLNAMTPGDFAKKSVLVTTGAEAVETPSRWRVPIPAVRVSSPSPAPFMAARCSAWR